MRTTLILVVLTFVTGCSTPSKNKIQPAPVAIHDNKTPVALAKPTISQRAAAQRSLDAQIAQKEVNVEGQVR